MRQPMSNALRSWDQREEVRVMEMARLKKAYQEGIASGPARAVEAKALLDEFKTKFKAKASSRG